MQVELLREASAAEHLLSPLHSSNQDKYLHTSRRNQKSMVRRRAWAEELTQGSHLWINKEQERITIPYIFLIANDSAE